MYKKAGDREKVVRIKSEIGVLVVVDKMVFIRNIEAFYVVSRLGLFLRNFSEFLSARTVSEVVQ